MARLARVSCQWLRQEAEEGRMPCLRVGDAFLFNTDAVENELLQRAAEKPRGEEEGDR